ncbi:hypothetical protein SUDANB67_03401 [Nocardiopsis dassonvillei]|uniref:hypothetical protein n=1 Tax=Nocardiopsis dassonvillei TaxID=2014 RepID=UPI003F57E248
MEPTRPKPWFLLGSIALFAVHIIVLVTPPVIGGKPYGMTLFYALPAVFAAYMYRFQWAHYQAHQSRPPSEEEEEAGP